MTIPISGVAGTGETAAINPSAGAKTGHTTADATPAPIPAGADSANVSQTQSLLETINATAAAVPTVNQDQVTALRSAIQNGTYQINAQQVAKQLLHSEQVLPGPVTTGE